VCKAALQIHKAALQGIILSIFFQKLKILGEISKINNIKLGMCNYKLIE